jgi:hypothetical protein
MENNQQASGDKISYQDIVTRVRDQVPIGPNESIDRYLTRTSKLIRLEWAEQRRQLPTVDDIRSGKHG